MNLAWQQIPHPIVSEILCQSGYFQGVVLDTEHSFFTSEVLFSCIQVITLSGKKCYVRLPDVDKSKIRQCLDAGADGLIFSTVERLEQVTQIKKHSCFAKWGGQRGLGLVRENKWGTSDLENPPPVLIAQIETLQGIRNLKSIRDTGVFNYYMLGPYDLSSSCGTSGDFSSEEYLSAIAEFNKEIERDFRAVHIPRDVKKELTKYKNYAIVAQGMDTICILEQYRELEDA